MVLGYMNSLMNYNIKKERVPNTSTPKSNVQVRLTISQPFL